MTHTLMRPIFVAGLTVALTLGACCPPSGTSGSAGDSSSTGSTITTTSSTCSCDCPQGPPPCDPSTGLCPVDTFCGDAAHAGEACCRPGGGVCQNHECASCGERTPAFAAADTCFEPTCCDTPESTLAAECAFASRLTPHPVVCAMAPGPNDTDGRQCAQLEVTVRCAWGEGVVFTVLCCEEPPSGP